ncbi:MAG: adenylate/guanylate cyclase domain-containing protein, partial [Pseudomonadota bacterium]
IAYMTGNAILLGAEFDKIISILVVTVILSAALWRGRALLVRSVAEGMAAQSFSRFFAPEVAAQIASTERGLVPGTGALREAAVVNLDLRGFTRFVEDRSPEEVMDLLNDYQNWVVPIFQRHGGSIDKFLGDGVLATFGAAVPSETAAADALRALEDVLAEGEAWYAARVRAGRPAARVNGALATGRVLFGTIGDESRLEVTVIGDPVNLCAKLEKHNKVLRSTGIVAASARDLAVAQGYQGAMAGADVLTTSVAGVDQAVEVVAFRMPAPALR